MLEFAKGDETKSTTVGILVSGDFYISKIFDGEIKILLQNLNDLFDNELELPARQNGYSWQAYLVEDIIKKLHQVINTIDTDDYQIIEL